MSRMSSLPIALIVLLASCGTQRAEPQRSEPEQEPARLRAPAAVAPAPSPVAAPEGEMAEPVAVPAPLPAYDLAADLEQREQLARKQLGAGTRAAVVHQVFLMVGPPSTSKSMFRRAVKLTERATAAYFNGRFDTPPASAVSVYVFGDRKSYQRFCRKHHQGCGTPYGVYFHAERRIVMNGRPGLGTLTHELVHPIIESDFPNAPIWINEGVASLFERPSIPRAGEIHGLKNWRYPRLARALRTRRGRNKADLRQLFSMSDAVFRGADEDLGYAMARYLCQWLDENKLLWAFYRGWRDDYAADPTGAKAFAKVVGKAPRAANSDWVHWLKRL